MLQFIQATLCAAALFYIPGLLISGSLCTRWISALGVAPAVSVALYCCIAIIFSLFGIAVSPVLLFVVTLFVAGCCLIVIKTHAQSTHQTRSASNSDALVTLAYLLFGTIAAAFIYIKSLAGFDAVTQTYDNYFHYNIVRALLDSQDWSMFHVSMYPALASGGVAPFITSFGSFYPIGWHTVSALTSAFTGSSIGIATNAINYVLAGIVFPLAVRDLIFAIFPDNKIANICGIVCAPAFAALPWTTLCAWPLFPNTMGLCLAPCVCAFFIHAFEDSETRRKDISLFVLASIGTAASQPNSIFTCGVFLAPYCVSRLTGMVNKRLNSDRPTRKIYTAIAIIALFAALWVLVSKLPPLQGVVSYYWAPISSSWQAMVDFVLCAYPVASPQLLLAILVACGAFFAITDGQSSWLAGSYVIAGFIYIVSASFGDNPVKHIVAGFWYTDPYRVAAVTAICGLPLACYGLAKAVLIIQKNARQHASLLGIAALALFVVVNYSPSYELRGVASIQSPFSSLRSITSRQTAQTPYAIGSSDKLAFMREVANITKNDLVINQPYDGSLFGYSLCDLNTYYRDTWGYGADDETSDSISIRNGLANIAVSNNIKSAVSSTGARYVLILDRDIEHMKAFSPAFAPSVWQGLLSIDDATDGFEIVLEQGDMRLYRIG